MCHVQKLYTLYTKKSAHTSKKTQKVHITGNICTFKVTFLSHCQLWNRYRDNISIYHESEPPKRSASQPLVWCQMLAVSISSDQWDSWNLCMTLGRCMAQNGEGWQVCKVCYGSPQASTRRACGHTTEEEAAAHNYEEPPTNGVYITPKTRCNLSRRRS